MWSEDPFKVLEKIQIGTNDAYTASAGDLQYCNSATVSLQGTDNDITPYGRQKYSDGYKISINITLGASTVITGRQGICLSKNSAGKQSMCVYGQANSIQALDDSAVRIFNIPWNGHTGYTEPFGDGALDFNKWPIMYLESQYIDDVTDAGANMDASGTLSASWYQPKEKYFYPEADDVEFLQSPVITTGYHWNRIPRFEAGDFVYSVAFNPTASATDVLPCMGGTLTNANSLFSAINLTLGISSLIFY